MNKLRAALAPLLSAALLSIALLLLSEEPKRADSWAQPIALPGLPNLHKVSDTLYRCAQPEKDGVESARKLGIKTIVNLREFHRDSSLGELAPIVEERIPLKTWDVDEDDAVKFLKIACDPAKAPVLVHCMHGADRTGAMCAVYRIAVQGWPKEAALREMTDGSFGYHEVWVNLPVWIAKLDVEKLRKSAGIKPPEAGK